MSFTTEEGWAAVQQIAVMASPSELEAAKVAALALREKYPDIPPDVMAELFTDVLACIGALKSQAPVTLAIIAMEFASQS